MKYFIKNALIINENKKQKGSVLIEDEYIKRVITDPNEIQNIPGQVDNVIQADNKVLIPGIIDDHVHFRDPGLTHKGDIYTESKAAVAGGVTSFMDMPNTNPPTCTMEEIHHKNAIASLKSFANYAFYLGLTDNNIHVIEQINPETIAGIKIFMGASTGNLVVSDRTNLETIFAHAPVLIATHCEDDTTIQSNLQNFTKKYDSHIPIEKHPDIRSPEACYKSTKKAIELAEKHSSNLHLLHLSTQQEIELLRSLSNNKISGEACIHHLWFTDEDYTKYGPRIRWNPAIKQKKDQEALRKALLDNVIEIIGTDHAPHTAEEKQIYIYPENYNYTTAPSGSPSIQHGLLTMLELHYQNILPIETIVQKMSHNPAYRFNISKRGYIREGYYADLALIDLHTAPWQVNQDNLLYKCKWSPFDGVQFHSKITHTFVNGNLIFENGTFNETIRGKQLKFNR